MDELMQDAEAAGADAIVSDEDVGSEDELAQEQVFTEHAKAPYANMIDPELHGRHKADDSEINTVDFDSDSLMGRLASGEPDDFEDRNRAAVLRDGLEIRVPLVTNPEEYVVFSNPGVSAILQKYDNEGEVSYLARLTDARVEDVRCSFP